MTNIPSHTASDEERWILEVTFDPPNVQAHANPELTFPYDEVSRFVTYLSEYWSLLPEELQEFVRWDNVKLTATAELIDNFVEPLRFLMMHMVPQEFTLRRAGAR
jgi:hypothetical protein